MMTCYRRFVLLLTLFSCGWAGSLPIALAAEEIAVILDAGYAALKAGDTEEAVRRFSQAVEKEPENHLALRGLADSEIARKNYKAAEALLDRILAMPTAHGRDILVTPPGETKPRPAELVDESVMAVDETDGGDEDMGSLSKFLKSVPREPVPHYRVNFKDTGEMKLLPKSKTRIEHHGLPAATREQVMALKTEVQKKVIASAETAPVEEDLVYIAGGCFQMGSTAGDPDEQPVHEVCLSAFRIGRYEVTQKHFQMVMGFNPSQHVGGELPVDSVTWGGARDYCQKLGLRLPREAEWEFAARGGAASEFYWGENVSGSEGNFCDSACDLNIRSARLTDGFKHTAPVGSFPPNPYGLFDMAGNVSEWVQDWMEEGYYRQSPRDNPPGPRADLDACLGEACLGSFSITQKVYRGGSWNQHAGEMRSANRRDAHIQLRPEGTGFRCAGD